MTEETSFNVNLEQQQDYRFKLEFDWDNVAPLLLDSAPPLGHAAGPDAERILAGAVAYCLTASLLFCMRKFKQTPRKLRTEVSGTLVRNERGRLRVGKLAARLHLSEQVEQIAHFDRCAQDFEDFCVVTDSIRHGIPVHVEIVDATGRQVYADEAAERSA